VKHVGLKPGVKDGVTDEHSGESKKEANGPESKTTHDSSSSLGSGIGGEVCRLLLYLIVFACSFAHCCKLSCSCVELSDAMY